MTQDDYRIAEHLPLAIDRPNMRQIAQLADEMLAKIGAHVKDVSIYPRIDELSGDLVDILAAQLHVDYYAQSLPLPMRRELVKQSIRWHIRKGTKVAVNEFLGTVFAVAHVKEWYEYGGKPYHFRVVTSDQSIPITDPTAAQKFMAALWDIKNVRSWLDGVDFHRNIKATLGMGTIVSTVRKYTLRPPYAQSEAIPIPLRMGTIASTMRKYTLLPHMAMSGNISIAMPTRSITSTHKRVKIR